LGTTESKRDLRIVFFGTPEFAVGILKSLVDAGKNIVGVITAPDKPAGRGRKLRPSAVKEYAVSKNLTVLQPTNLKNEFFLEELRDLNANLQVIVAFRMLPKVVWEMPKFGTFNLHASLLPQYRGAAPINWAIINREIKTGVTTFFIDEKIDTGEIIAKSEIAIEANETVGTLHDKLMLLGSDLVLETIKQIEEGKAKTIPQPNYGDLKEAPKLNPDNTKIDWSQTAEQINAFIRGLSPYPGAWTWMNSKDERLKMKIYEATVELEDHNNTIGTLICSKKEIRIAVKDGYLKIIELQLPGKKKMEAAALLNGYTFNPDTKLL
jgi:methionyl-tRNA formyltransferase